MVQYFFIAHAQALPCTGDKVGSHAHVFGAACNVHIAKACLNRGNCVHNAFHAAAAHHVYGVGGDAGGDARANAYLAANALLKPGR